MPIPALVCFISCHGYEKNMCSTNQCVCVAHKLKCTDLCACFVCQNDLDKAVLSDSDVTKFKICTLSCDLMSVLFFFSWHEIIISNDVYYILVCFDHKLN